MRCHFVVPALLLSLLTPSVGASQTFVTTTAHRVPFERVDSLTKLLKETRSVLTEAKRLGGIVDDVWLIHAWGGEASVVQMTTWKSWAAINDTTVGFDAATRKAYPDWSLERKLTIGSSGSFKG